MKKAGNYNILSIDGGGIRGLIALMQIVEIEKMCDGKLLDHFHLISGTSTGGIIATLIADGYTAKELIDIYREHGPYIFEKKWYRKGIFRAKYDDTYFNNVITKYCADRKIINLEADVIIPAYNISTMRVELFKRSNKFMDLPLRDAIRATASAQTYFEPWVINGEKYIDGGMAVNNPSEYCFAEAKDKVGNMRINILSVGTGIVEKPLKGTGGMLKWAKPTVDILLAEMSQKTHELLTRYYKREEGTYLRCESYVKLSSGLIDDASRENIENMISDGNYSANCNRNSIKTFIENTKP